MASAITIQTGAHQYDNDSLTKYSLMMGGLNVTHEVLRQYDPLVGGYPRIFMVRKPLFLTKTLPDKMVKFKHILEYGNVGIGGIGNITLQTSQVTGGYAGRSFDVPTVAQDETSGFQISVYEFSGSPVRELLYSWVNGISDIQSGLSHYNGLIATGQLPYSQANHTAEFIYVVTDRTGMKVEYACQFCNCFPKGVNDDQFNATDPASHELIKYDIDFTATKYVGIDINKKAAILLKNYQILMNSLEFYSGITAGAGENYTINTQLATGYDNTTGQLTKQDNIRYFTEDNVKFNTGATWKKNGVEAIKVTPSFTTKGNQSM